MFAVKSALGADIKKKKKMKSNTFLGVDESTLLLKETRLNDGHDGVQRIKKTKRLQSGFS